MKKLFLLFALLVIFAFPNGAFSADGDELSTTSFRVDSSGLVVHKTAYEVVTTDDTITAAETGKVFLMNSSTDTVTLTLPTAAAGLTYTFTAINGSTVSGRGRLYIDPAATDTIIGCNTQAWNSYNLGDKTYNSSTTGDSVTMIGASTKWYCINKEGTWSDGN